jgi:hypothetical protein
LRRAGHRQNHPPRLIFGQHHRHPHRPVGSHSLDVVQRLMEHLPIEKQQCVECLILRRRRHLPPHGQIAQKQFHLGLRILGQFLP